MPIDAEVWPEELPGALELVAGGSSLNGEAWINSHSRRAFEIAVVAGGGLGLGGIALGAAAAIGITEGRGNVLTRVERSLIPGKTFNMYKLGNPERGGLASAFCVRTMLDEFPQALSVLKGSMALIAPRGYPLSTIERLYDSIEDAGLRNAWHEVRQIQKGGIINKYSISSHARNLHGLPVNRRVKSDDFAKIAELQARDDIYDLENASFKYDVGLLRDTTKMAGRNYKRLIAWALRG